MGVEEYETRNVDSSSASAVAERNPLVSEGLGDRARREAAEPREDLDESELFGSANEEESASGPESDLPPERRAAEEPTPEQGAENPASNQHGEPDWRRLLREQAGVPIDAGATDEQAFSELRQAYQLVQNYPRLQQQMREMQALLHTQQQENQRVQEYFRQQAEASEQAKTPWEIPDWDSAAEQHLQLDEQGNVVVRQGAVGIDPLLPQKYLAHQQAIRSALNEIVTPGGLNKVFDQMYVPRITQMIQQGIQSHLGHLQSQQYQRQAFAQDEPWMYEHSANGQALTDLQGNAVLSVDGRAYAEAIQAYRADHPEVTDPAKIRTWALMAIGGAPQRAANPAAKAQAAAQSQAAVTREPTKAERDAKRLKELQRGHALRTPSVTGGTRNPTNGNGAATTQGQRARRAASDHPLADSIPAEGFSVDQF